MITGLGVVLGLVAAVLVIVGMATRLGVAYPILLVIVGSALALVPGLPNLELDPELFLYVVLPPLIYSTALSTSPYELKANRRPILVLAVTLVLVTMGAVGAVVHALVPAMGWAAALTLGAIVAPPDPIAASEVAGRVGLPARVTSILEGEGLINDATALTAYQVTIGAVVGSVTVLGIVFDFGRAVLVGVGLGLIVAWLVGQAVRRAGQPQVVNAILLLLPFVAYLSADLLGGSGVLAVVSAALFQSRDAQTALGATDRLRQQGLWQLIGFLLTGTAFLLVGLELRTILAALAGSNGPVPGGIPTVLVVVAAAAGAVILTRIVAVFAFAARARGRRMLQASLAQSGRGSGGRGRRRTSPTKPDSADSPDSPTGPDSAFSAADAPWRGVAVISWAGMRGAISLAAALALPTDFPYRDLILTATFGVILATLVGQGLTLAPLVRRLDVVSPELEKHVSVLRARKALESAALDTLAQLGGADPGTPDGTDDAMAPATPGDPGSDSSARDEAIGRANSRHQRRLRSLERAIDQLVPGESGSEEPAEQAASGLDHDREVARQVTVVAGAVRDAQRQRLDQLERAGQLDGDDASALRRGLDSAESGLSRGGPR